MTTKRWMLTAAISLALLGLVFVFPRSHAQDYPKLAPYSSIRWEKGVPEVEIEGEWYGLRAIDETSVEDILVFAKSKYRDRWQKRFEEDLVQVLSEMGHAPGRSVRLEIVDLETGVAKVLERVPMTNANRQAIWRERGRHRLASPPRPFSASQEAMEQALETFAAALDERWSYRHANDADFARAVAEVRKRVESGISLEQFGIELNKVIALGIDGHAGVSDAVPPSRRGYLPFIVEPAGEHFVAFRPERDAFLAESFPHVTSIDGEPIGEWCRAVAQIIPRGSPQYVRWQCLGAIRHLELARQVLGLPWKDTVEVELSTADGAETEIVTLPVAVEPPVSGPWPRTESRLLDGGIGYLRLPRMNREAVQEIERWMARFRETEGLIVDVRGNSGGSREALLRLHEFLVAPEAPPRVVNVAAYRLHPEHEKDHLAARFMYRANASHWTAAERRAIAEQARSFRPEWAPPPSEFSEWHYLVLGGGTSPGSYHYTKPVVVLMNAKCFSATDIFLAGLKGLEGVTLLGEPSGGGSARSRSVVLEPFPWELRIGSMASFRADGRLFDGNGVAPDVVVEPVPEYYIGGTDNVLAKAVEWIEARQIEARQTEGGDPPNESR